MKGFVLCTILLCSSVVRVTSESNAGFRFRVTNRGLNYASTTLVDLLRRKLDRSIEDARGEHGDFKYEITNIKAEPIPRASSRVELRPPVMAVSLYDVDISLSADWSYSYRRNRFIHISDSGSMKVRGTGLSIEIEASFGFDPGSKLTSIGSSSCRAGLNDLRFEAHGKVSLLYETLFSLARRPLEDLLKGELCRAANRGINENINEELSSLSMQAKLDSDLFLDYQLLSSPAIKSDSIEFSHAGTVFGDLVPRVPLPSDQPSFCDTRDDSMVEGLVTEDFLNSYLRALHVTGKMKKLITRNDFSESEKMILDTNCRGVACVAKWITRTVKNTPNASLEIDCQVDEVPLLRMEENGNVSMGISFRSVVLVRYQNDTVRKLFAVLMNASMSAVLVVDKGLLRFSSNVLDQKVLVEEDETEKEANVKGVEVAMKMLRKKLMSHLNGEGSKGIPIPDAGNFVWIDTGVRVKNRALCFSTNLKYRRSD